MNKNSHSSRDRFDTNMEERLSPDDDTLKQLQVITAKYQQKAPNEAVESEN